MRRIYVFFGMAWLLVAATAVGQTSTTAILRGTVTNDSGSPVANAEINAVNTGSGFVKTVKSGSDGAYTLAGLSPGTYNIVVAAPGFEPKTQDITVLVGQSLQLDLRVSTTAVLKESITVVGNQAVETRTSEIATNVTTQQIENLPQDDRNFLNFAALAPGIRLSTNPQRKTFAGDAQDPEQTNIFIDGVSTKNDVLQGGTVGQDSSRGNPFPQSAVQEFRVITQNYSAQYDHASSAIITAVTKSGTNEFKGEAFGFYQPKQWVSATKKNFQFSTLTGNTSYHRIQPGISFGGPIIKDHLQFFATYEGDDEQASNSVAVTIPKYASQFSNFSGSFNSPFKSNLAFGKLSWQAAANQTLDFSGSYRREHETRDFGGTTSFESATNYKNWVYGATLRDQMIFGNALNEASASLQSYGWNPEPQNPGLVGKLYFAPGFATIIRTGGNSTLQDFNQRRIELRDNFNFAPMEMAGTHSFQVGGNVDFMHYNVNKSLNGIPLYKFIDDPAGGNTFAQPFEVDYGLGNPIFKTSNNEYGIYGQDSWTVNPRLTLNLGLRWDYESHMLDENYVTPANIVAALKGKTFAFDGRTISIPDEYFSTGSERKPYKSEYQPRFGFAYDIGANGKSVAFGGWGKYYDRLFLNSTLDERFRLQFPVYRFEFSPDGRPGTIKWNDAYGTAAGLQSLIAQGAAHPEIYLLSNNTKPPYSTQYNVGFRQTIGSWLGSASYNAVRGKRGITYVAASGTCCGAFAPGYNAVIINDPVGKSFWYDAESLTLDRPFTNQTHWGARFTYTHAKSEQNGNDLFSLDLPSAAAYARHPVPGSEPNHFNATGIFGIPWDMRFSTSVTLGSGGATPITDFSKGFSLAGRLQTGVKRGAVYPKNGFRNVDFRLTKDFNAVRGTTVAVIAEVFNALNFTNYGCLNDFVGDNNDRSTLGNPNCVVSLGRREQVGLRLTF
ncbi:MAG TPA: TonB-dependent receptor [Thermoanaerobaculia bacterium]|nr:TonB-dependent receptor [Thermoanaerobaculia bacterium]